MSRKHSADLLARYAAFDGDSCGNHRPTITQSTSSRLLRRKLHEMFARHLGSVGDAGADVILFQPGILAENLVGRHSAGEQIQNQRHPNSMTADARLAKTNLRADPDSGEQCLL